MGLIEVTLQKIKDLTGLNEGELSGIHSQTIYDGIERIRYRLTGFRLSGQNGNFSIKFCVPGRCNLFMFCMSEFPSCCGSGILHSINISHLVDNADDKGFKLSDDKYSELVSLVLKLAEGLFTDGYYSSFDFILSDIDNTSIYDAVRRIGIKPTASWRNSRYPSSHNCNNYNVFIVKTHDADYLQKSQIVTVG